jgi:RimJ/RimL family protein N-acetyltransferase
MFDTTLDYILENNRVQLKPLQSTDIDFLLPFSIQEPDLWTYSLVSAAGKNNLQSYIEAAIQARAAQREYPFIVFDKQTNTYAGETRFYDIQLFHQTLQLGYTWYGKEYQGTGLNRNCKYLLLEFAFEQMNMQRVEFRADNNNKRSIQAMKSIGCKEEGILRSNCANKEGLRRDSIVLSILKKEWDESVKESLKRMIEMS